MHNLYNNKQKIKIAIITFSGKLSGMLQYSYELALEIGNFDISCDLFINEHFKPDNGHQNINIKKIFRRSRHIIIDIIRLFYAIARNKYNIIHFQNTIVDPKLTILILFTLKLLKIKTIITIHDILPHYRNILDVHIFKILYNIPDGIIVHSIENKLFLEKILKITNDHNFIEVIPHGIFTKYAKNKVSLREARKFLGIHQSKIVILFFGHIDKRKGAEFLISLAPKFIKNNPNVLFLFAGKDTYTMGHLENYAKKLGILDNIIIHREMIPDELVDKYFSAANIVALPYLEGSTSGVMKIAFSFKKFVLATNVGEFPSAIREYSHGYIIDENFNEEIADKIIAFSTSLDHKPNETYLDYCSWNNCARETIKFYKKILT